MMAPVSSVRVQLQAQGRTQHHLGVEQGQAAGLGPALPADGRELQLLGRAAQRHGRRRPIGKAQEHRAVQGELAPALDVAQGQVALQEQRAAVALHLDGVVPHQHAGGPAPVVQARIEVHPQADPPAQGAQKPDQPDGPLLAPVPGQPRREIDQLPARAALVEAGAQDIGRGQVAHLARGLLAPGKDAEHAPRARVQEPGEHGRAVEARQAKPLHRAGG